MDFAFYGLAATTERRAARALHTDQLADATSRVQRHGGHIIADYFHSSRRRQHVIPDPNPSSWGRNSHWMPVCSTNKIPHNTCRSGTRFRPGRRESRGTCLGSSGSIRSHNPSGTIHGGCSPRRTAQHGKRSSTRDTRCVIDHLC